MGTAISEVLVYIRAAVQDYDADCYLYTDQALQQQVSLTVLQLSFDPISGTEVTTYAQDGDGNFIGDLTSQQKLIVGIKTAIRLLSNVPREFSYKSPVFSVTRKHGNSNTTLLDALDEMLTAAEGGRFALETDTDFNAIVQGFDRFINDYNRACTAWSGS